LAATLRRRDADVLFADIPPDLGVNGIDDVAGQHGAERALEIIHSAYEPVIEPRKLTDLGNAERLVDRHGDCFRWSEEFGCWFVWNGQYWERDHKRQVNHWAREVVRASNLEASDLTQRKARLEAQLATQTDGEQDSKLREEIEKLDKRAKPIYAWAKKSEASARIRGLVDLARSEDGVPVLASELDTHPLLFPVENCTIDLETGKARPHQREDLLTMISPVRYVEGAECQRWLQYLNEVFRQYPDIPSWLQRAVGSCLTGLIREHVFFQLYGEGRNGKSTSLHVMEALLGDYAITVPFAVFTEASRWRAAEAPQPFLVRFRGVRFVCAQEPKEGAVFNEELIKTITGGDTISARTLHEKPIEFLPTHKVWLSGNHKPEIHGTDLGIWSRPRLIPFSEQFPEGGKTTDPNLVNALLKELPGILNWAIEGCLLWLKEGLGTCATVKAATDQYRKDEDILKPWIENCCDVMYGNTLRARRGYESFSNFLGGKAPISEKAFAGRMRIKGFVKDDDMYGAFYRGIGLNQRSTSDQSTINSKVNSPGG
jgi:putative DNA primase/helicase